MTDATENQKQKKHRYVVRTASMDDQSDVETIRELYAVMRSASNFSHVQYREGGLEQYEDHYRSNDSNQLTLLAYCDDEPIGLFGGIVQFQMGLQYIVAHCQFLYVVPGARDGKAAMMMIAAFREWAEKRGADELRFTVTSLDNIEKSHQMLEGLHFRYLGGNFAYPLTEKGWIACTPSGSENIKK